MKFAIDQINDEIAVLENLETAEKKELNLSKLPPNIKDGTILDYTNDEYIVDEITENIRRKIISARFNRLKKK